MTLRDFKKDVKITQFLLFYLFILFKAVSTLHRQDKQE
jgi:hypothetical protein